jgi:ankyrin repeat protein
LSNKTCKYTFKMTRLLSLPNEILIAIAASVVDPRDVAALALTNGRLFSIANPALYAAAAQHSRHTRRALFYSAENGFINSVRRLLSHGVNPNVIYVAPVPRDCLHHVLAAQGRRPGRQPLIDRRLALEAIQVTLRGTERETGLSEAYRALLSTVFADTDSKPDLADTISLAYSFLIYELQILVTQTDRVFNPIIPDAETHADSTSVWDTDNMFQWTALHVAAQRGDNELVELLLDSGAAVDPLLRHRESVPHMGVLEGIFESSLVPPAFETPLHLAISAGHDSTAHLLLASGASAATGYRGVTALHIAAWHGALELCRVMVDGDASLVDARTGTQLTPFHYAVAAGHLQTVGRFLLDRGADMRALLNARVSERAGGMQQIWSCNAFTHALLARRYSDALMLLAMDPELAVPGRNDLHPIQACLLAPNLCESDEDQVVPILRRLLLRDGAHADPLIRRLFSRCLKETAAKHLPQAWRLLLETAEDSASRNLTFNDWVTEALRGTQSIASSWTLTQLLHRVVSAQGISMPGIVSVFPPGFVHGERPLVPRRPPFYADDTSNTPSQGRHRTTAE